MNWKKLGKKAIVFATNLELLVPLAALLLFAVSMGLFFGVIANIVAYVVINLLEKDSKRINLFGITPPSDDPPPQRPPDGDE